MRGVGERGSTPLQPGRGGGLSRGRRRALPILPVAALCLLALSPGVARPQAAQEHDRTAADHKRAVELIEAVVAALGGSRYTSVKSISSRGVFHPFSQGRPTVPMDFVDTTVFPDKGRTEFGKKKNLVVQTNARDRGWKYDGPRGALTAQTPEEVGAFQLYVRGNIDNVLRTFWRGEGVRLRSLGRTELRPREWVEGVSVEYPDGFRVEIYVDPQTKLPVLSRYREQTDNGGSGSLLETRYNMYLDFGGVKVPRFVDLYRDGVQTARVVNVSVELNPVVPPSYFEQPASVAAFKQ